MSAHPRKVSFIVNPVSGHRWSQKKRRVHALLESLKAQGVEVLTTDRPQQAMLWSKARADDPNAAVVAVGGDGTVHEVARGLIGGQASLGVLPIGSGNDFASMLENNLSARSLEASALMAHFCHAPSSRVDVGALTWTDLQGQTHQAHFINSLGLGVEGAIAGTVTRLRSVKGLSRYVLATLWQLIQYRPLAMRLLPMNETGTDEALVPILLVAIGNGRRAGGGFVLQPKASMEDGRLDVCWAQAMPLWRQLMIFPSVFAGQHGRFKEIHQTQLEAIEIECPVGTELHLDGEWLPQKARHLSIHVQPGALKVIGR